MHEQKRKIVEAFMYLVEQDMKNGILPASNTKRAKAYVEEMIGRKI
jgi:hypothetical protein